MIPKENVKYLSGMFSEDGVDDSEFWNNSDATTSLFRNLENILPLNKSWSDSIVLYGTQESNLVEIFHDKNGKVEAASFRINFTTHYGDLLRDIIEFCVLNGLAIVDENWQNLQLNQEVIVHIIENSPQKKKYGQLMGNI